MNYVVWLLITFALLGLESPLLGSFEMQLYAPDVLLLSAVYIAVRGDQLPGLVTVFFCGLLKDGFALASPVGLFTEIAVLTFLLARLLLPRVDLRSLVPLMATAAGATLSATGVFWLLVSVFDRDFAGHDQVLQAALPLTLATMLVAPVQFWLLDRGARLFGRRDRSGMVIR